MDFKTFSHILFNRIGNGISVEDFVQQLFFNIADIDSENTILDKHRSTFIRYYTGAVSINKIAKELLPYIDKQTFQDYLVSSCNEDIVPLLVTDFEAYGYEMDAFDYDEKIANIFVDILSGKSKSSKSAPQPVINNMFINGALAPQEILNTPLNRLNQTSAKRLNESISIANILASDKLPEELKPYYKVELKNSGNGFNYTVIPKSIEATQKYPIKFNFKFSAEDGIIEQFNNLRSLQNEANRNNRPVALGHPLSVKETIGEYENPFPILPTENVKSATLYIGPIEEPKTITVKLYMYNEFISYKLENVIIQRLEEYDEFCRFSNARFENDWYDFILDLGPSKVSLHISPRETAKITADQWLQMYKYRVLIADSKSTIRLNVDGIEKPLFEAPSSGKKEFKPKEINDINNLIDRLNKLLQIEDRLGMTFDFDYSEFSNNTFAVDLLYYVLSKKKKSFASFSSWICEGTGTLKEDIKVGAKLSFTNDLSFVEIFGKRVPVNGMQVYIKDALIKSIDYNEDDFTIKYTSDYVKLIPKK